MPSQLTIWGTPSPDGEAYSPHVTCPCGHRDGYPTDVLAGAFVPYACPTCGAKFTRADCRRAYRRTDRAQFRRMVSRPWESLPGVAPWSPSTAWSAGPDASPIENFRAVRQMTPKTPPRPPLTITDLAALMADAARRFPRPTDAQIAWAKANGFPGWPGFKVGTRAVRALRASTSPRVESVQGRAFPVPDGVPFVVDQDIDPDVVLSAEDQWNKEN